jgi:hypothetical protein
MLPLWRSPDGHLQSMTTPYSCLFEPWLAADAAHDDLTRALSELLRASQCAAIRLEAMDSHSPATHLLAEAAKNAGRIVLSFDHFVNWYQDVCQLSWQDYLCKRPGALRTTIGRRIKQMRHRCDPDFEVLDGPDDIDAGICAYETVYQRSWKPPEPFPSFNAKLIRAFSASHALRLAILRLDGQPIATQFWIVWQGEATMLKTAYDAFYKKLSPGTTLTAMVLQRLLNEENIRTIDFGRGDDRYKADWATQRRSRVGMVMINPRHPTTWGTMLRHQLGRLLSSRTHETTRMA